MQMSLNKVIKTGMPPTAYMHALIPLPSSLSGRTMQKRLVMMGAVGYSNAALKVYSDGSLYAVGASAC